MLSAIGTGTAVTNNLRASAKSCRYVNLLTSSLTPTDLWKVKTIVIHLQVIDQQKCAVPVPQDSYIAVT